MGYLEDGHNDSSTVDAVQDSISTDPDAVDIFIALESSTSCRARVNRKTQQRPDDAQAVLAANLLELFLRSSSDLDPITCHPAQGP